MKNKIRELTVRLNKSSESYYHGQATMSDTEFDRLLDELSEMEKKAGYRLSNSPTVNVGANAIDSLEKVTHVFPMLSLDKCHSVDDLIKFIDGNPSVLMYKMDGLTIRATYEKGILKRLETRGNGQIGNDVTHLAKAFVNLPSKLMEITDMIVDGECVITYDDFEAINDEISDKEEKYKNPRNLAAGSLSVLKYDDIKNRPLKFFAWRIIQSDKETLNNSMCCDFTYLESNGFTVTPYLFVYSGITNDNLREMIDICRNTAKVLHIPIDGCVVAIDSIAEGYKRGKTDKFFKHSIAYKYEDDKFSTKVVDVEWTTGKTGQITPTLIFEPIEIDGTTVSRASMHNVSIFKQLHPSSGCTAYIYKANMIIPQCDFCEDDGKEYFTIPTKCPACGGEVKLVRTDKTEYLSCINPGCSEKILRKLSHFVSKEAFDIDGLSEATIEKFIELGWVVKFSDIFSLHKHYSEMINLDKFGVRSVQKLIRAIDLSRDIKMDNFLCSLSIPLIGKTASKQIADIYKYDWTLFIADLTMNDYNKLRNANGIGELMLNSIRNWFENEYHELSELESIVKWIVPTEKANNDMTLSGMTFCITGSIKEYKNRSELKALIESKGGKVTDSVTSKTSYLINNDNKSNSSKNKKAADLGIPVITEEGFKVLLGDDK